MASPGYSTVSNAFKNAQTFQRPKYLVDAAKGKFGQRIQVIGSTETEIETFKTKIRVKAKNFDPEVRPQEKGRTIIDIDVKKHRNSGKTVDSFEITTKKSSNQSRSKSYSLKLSKESTRAIGGNGSLNVSPQFFNAASVGVGLSASYSHTKTREETATDIATESIGQEFGIIEKIEVHPDTVAKATITTWAVTYETSTDVEHHIPLDIALPVRYRSQFQQTLCGLFSSIGYLTAADFYRGQNVAVDDDNLVVTSSTTFSYLGEEVDIRREEFPINQRR